MDVRRQAPGLPWPSRRPGLPRAPRRPSDGQPITGNPTEEQPMLLRCATGMLTGPVAMGAGLVFATGIATGMAVGAGLAGAAVLGKRMWEERQGWRAGTAAEDPLPPADDTLAEAPGV
jgi:hypothetical protein